MFPTIGEAAGAVEARTQGAKRMRVEERDAAVVGARCQKAAVDAERVVEDARAAAVEDSECGRAPQQRGEEIAAGREGVVECDSFTCKEQRPVELGLRQRLRAEALRDRRRRLPLRAAACRERDATGDQRRQQQDDGSREQRAQPPRRAGVRDAARLEERTLQVDQLCPFFERFRPLERSCEACATIELPRVSPARLPRRGRLRQSSVQAAPLVVLLDPPPESRPLLEQRLVHELDRALARDDETTLDEDVEHSRRASRRRHQDPLATPACASASRPLLR